MRLKIFAFVWFAALAVAPMSLSADTGPLAEPRACCEQPAAGCCDEKPCDMPCCEGESGCDMPCCGGHAAHAVDPIEPSAIEMLIAMDSDAIWPSAAETVDPIEPSAVEMLIAMDPNAILPLAAEDAPIRQNAVVWFHRPVWVGDTVLMGKYVIEHDTDRQARGEACTHIYAAGDMTVPVAAFHCTHLDRKSVEKNTVVLQSLPDGSQKLLEFQFAGEHAAHGFPTER
jgi:hypothetical protein